MSEKILCAAIWFKDGQKHAHQPRNVDSGFVICGRRHHNVFAILALIRDVDYMEQDIQGFVTTKDRFVDRKEAFVIATEQGQIVNPEKTRGNNLYSEDLY